MVGLELWILAVSLGVARVTGTIYLSTPKDMDLDVPYPPHVTAPLGQITKYITEDRPISVHCEAMGNPSPSLKWQFNGNPIATSHNMKEFPENGTLVISAFTSSMEGYYQCLAVNKHGVSLSAIVRMRKRVFPVFKNPGDPSNIKTVAEGDGIKLECTEKPYGLPQGPFHWYHVSKEKGNEQIQVRLKDHMDIDLNGNLYITDAKKEDEATTYACAMSSDNLVKVSIAQTPYVSLQVTDSKNQPFQPALLGSTGNATADIGGDVTLECFFSGQPRPRIVWLDGRRNQPVVNGSENNRVLISTNGHKLKIRRVRDDDQGQYICEANNTMGKASAIASLNVTSRPLFKTTSPQLIVAPVGSNPTFTCVAEGAIGEEPVSRPHWTKNGKPVPQNDNKHRFSDDGRELTLLDVIKDDMTCVQCNVSNSQGYDFGDGYLVVIDSLRIVARPNRTIEIEPGTPEGEEVNITIVASADRCCPVLFAWTFNGEYLAKSALHSAPFRYDHQEDQNRATLTLRLSGDPEKDGERMGEYRCDVWHHAYEANATVKVTLKLKEGKEPEKAPVKDAGFNLWWLALVAGVLVLIAAAVIIFLMVHFNYPRQAYLLEKEEKKHNLDRDKDILDHSFEEI